MQDQGLIKCGIYLDPSIFFQEDITFVDLHGLMEEIIEHSQLLVSATNNNSLIPFRMGSHS